MSPPKCTEFKAPLSDAVSGTPFIGESPTPGALLIRALCDCPANKTGSPFREKP
jgi:hypothetical protein